jgi:protein-L-isoaspartate(D-aspartate) O-methyltransferase
MNSLDFPVMRRAMIDSQLRTSGVNAPWVIAAMGAAERERFVLDDRGATAYMDRSVPLGGGRALNPPLATGLMLDAAEIAFDDTLLLIGAATGYVAQLIANRAASVTAVEQSPTLLAAARANLSGISSVALIEARLSGGYSDNALYSLIIIDGAIAVLPDAITDQLAEGGRLVTGLVEGAVSRLAIGYKRGGAVVLRGIADCEIAPLPGFERAKEFVF